MDLDHGLDYGLEYGLDYGLDYGPKFWTCVIARVHYCACAVRNNI